MKVGTRVRLKRWNDRGEFELDRAKSKNNISENSSALGHETHNSWLSIHYQKKYIQKTLKQTLKR